ncbi:MAG TPA: hypothetical protein VH300_01935 [Thermoleophilaceae bacterium]|nr:hypothetical protein [Thermoleophilaceae bacterium]
MTARTPVLAIGALAAATAPALAHTFGAEPVAVSSGAHAPSGGPTISGDNHNARYVAFHSFASNLIRGDTNGALDVFVLDRSRGGIARASVSSRGRQANGPSANPALDGSVQRAPHCVAFQSQATNLAPGDRDRSWDIYVRDLRSHKTRLVSRGVGASAVDPAIGGDCRQVAFSAAGRIWIGNGLRSRRAHVAARGTNPDLSLDGSALTWERGHGVWLRRKGHTTRVAAIGGNPRVSDGGASQKWGVVFDTQARLTRGDTGTGFDVYLRTFGRTGGVRSTRLISGRAGRSLGGDSHNGGITAYAPVRGIVVFTTTRGPESTMWFANLHTGNIDDLAYAPANGSSKPGIFDAVSSARANYVVFSSTGSFARDTNGPTQDVFLKFLAGK